jgi:hypothetical protein
MQVDPCRLDIIEATDDTTWGIGIKPSDDGLYSTAAIDKIKNGLAWDGQNRLRSVFKNVVDVIWSHDSATPVPHTQVVSWLDSNLPPFFAVNDDIVDLTKLP